MPDIGEHLIAALLAREGIRIARGEKMVLFFINRFMTFSRRIIRVERSQVGLLSYRVVSWRVTGGVPSYLQTLLDGSTRMFCYKKLAVCVFIDFSRCFCLF